MKKNTIMNKNTVKKSAFAFMAAAFLMSAMPGDEPITKEGNTTIVNTTTIASDIQGYVGATPLKIYIVNNKIEHIEALPNQETPKYFLGIKKKMLKQWDGMTVNKAIKAKVDGITGATYSSDCVKETVKRGLEYYKKNKK